MSAVSGDHDFAPSPTASLSICEIGAERHPVIVVDDAMRDPGVLVRFAAEQACFDRVDDNLYPGVRAPLPLAYANQLTRALDPILRAQFALGEVRLAQAECFFSIVTTQPEDLQPFQRIPHIDTTSPLHFAVVHFLCDERFGGTGFFRQKATGFETIEPDREARWAEERDRAMACRTGPARYIADDDPDYERIALFPAKFDRLLAYRSNALHSGHIPQGMPFAADPARGRMTANLFIGYRPA